MGTVNKAKGRVCLSAPLAQTTSLSPAGPTKENEMKNEIDQKLETLQTKIDAIKAERDNLLASSRAPERKIETRKKILIAEFVLTATCGKPERLRIGEVTLESYLKRPNDRRLFGFSETSSLPADV
jgi:hypothetical protein